MPRRGIQPWNRPLWHEVLTGRRPAVRLVAGHRTTADIGPRWVLPGSFNPRHQGMNGWPTGSAAPRAGRGVRAVDRQRRQTDVIRRGNRPAVDTSLARSTPSGSRGPRRLLRRRSSFPEQRFWWEPTRCCGLPTRATTPTGRRACSRRSSISRAKCRFLVFGRLLEDRFQTLDQLALPRPLAALCQAVSEADFREDISSTQLRCQAARTTAGR